METKTITINVRGSERIFTLRSNAPLSMHAWMQKARKSFDMAAVPVTEGDLIDTFVAPFMAHVLTTPELIGEAMRCAYIGDHAGIDWFNDVDAEVVRSAVGDFINHFFMHYARSLSAALTSSPPTPSGSEATATT